MPELVINQTVHTVTVAPTNALLQIAPTVTQLTIVDASATQVLELSNPAIVLTAQAEKLLTVVEQQASILEVAAQGPAGASGSTSAYTHTQTTESAEWIVNHNLGVKPVVEILTTGGVLVEAEVLHVTNNQLRIYFASLFTGTARCL